MTMKTIALLLAIALASAASLAVESAPQAQSPDMDKCRSAGEEARKNPNPCPTNDAGCAMKVQQELDVMLDACKRAMVEMMPLPLAPTPIR